MRLVRYEGRDERTRLGGIVEQSVIALDDAAKQSGNSSQSFTSMDNFLADWEVAAPQARKLAREAPGSLLRPLSEVRLRAPIARPGKIIAVGLNYRDHSIEAGAKSIPKTPILFAKFTTSIAGPNDPIVIPKSDPQVDYEAELAVVIGRKGKGIQAAQAYEYVAGYMPLNDVSARTWQFADKQWVRGKSCDTFCPIGPWLTTRDEITDPHTLAITARVNGVVLQNSNTSRMIFRIPELIAFISESITLDPGDIIATGTPEGVGIFRTPPILLKPGAIVEVEIENLGILRNPVVAEKT